MYSPVSAFHEHIICYPGVLNNPAFESKREQLAAQLENHPAYELALEKQVPQTHIRPVAIYADGVQYTNNDSFLGISVVDILTGLSFLSILLRTLVSYGNVVAIIL